MKPSKVLVVDDSELIQKMFRVIFRETSVVCAGDGRAALDHLAGHPDVDLIILDINMPRMNGLEFLAHVKQEAAFSEVPVVIVSTEGEEEDTIRGLEAGASAYVKKPFQPEDLSRIIGRL